ncbi:histidine kinase [Flammeovirgaceae bacterium SG7u.111]|nr:histidine kinase [Flammeovirgaceae bacterium SG7u.132]WPO34580.1 histidine kinase [Flammeovirgaceae bacterium SG7u.111]
MAKILKKILFPLLYLIGLLVYYFEFWPDEETASAIFYIAAFWLACVIFLLWIGNYLIYSLLNRALPWTKKTLARFYVQLALSGIYSLSCVNLTYYLFKTNFTELPPDSYQLTLLNIYGIIFTLPVISIQFGIFFMNKWKKVAVEKESLEKERITTELLALKSHIDPHFLFNNLNILSSLIEPDNDPALAFLDKFSEVYRYVLKSKDSEFVTLDNELGFIEAYFFILEKRFEGQMKINYKVDDKYKMRQIPPLALQMLIENALKHNKYSYKRPLTIDIFTSEDGELLTVRNNFQPKEQIGSQKHGGSGLNNIRKRYELVSNEEIEVEKTETHFRVSIPLIKLVEA